MKKLTTSGGTAKGRALSRADFLKIAGGAAGLTAGVVGMAISNPEPARAQGKGGGGSKTALDTPLISCAGSTEVSINIQVCAGASGAPAGFSLQWMKLADYTANGSQWYASDDPRLCKGSFSGNAKQSVYALAADGCVTVNIGELLFDNGASTNCATGLECGTDYVFHAFAHATNSLKQSGFGGNITCSTLACGEDQGNCTFTYEYWKTHGPVGCNGGSNSNEWPVNGLTLGNRFYTDSELCSILNTASVPPNYLVALAHQLIAAKLNIANGADGTDAAACIALADTRIGDRVIPPIGTGSIGLGDTGALITCLVNYNEGATGPGHCD